MLRDAGHVVLIWPQPKPSRHELKTIRGWVKLVRWFRLLVMNFVNKKDIGSPYNLQVAGNRDLKGAVVIYPEIVFGNPLGVPHVVRWLLNKPGVISGTIKFGSNDLFFYYHSYFNDWDLNPYEEHQLRIVELQSDVYKNPNYSERSGQCYMVRKGQNRELDYHEPDSKIVDGLSHRELAKVFSKYKYFICYDLYTMYCRYAAMCGCIPIVVPEEGLSKEEWRPEVANRFGIAYGWDDIPWALETSGNLLDFLAEVDRDNVNSLNKFVSIVEGYFSDQLHAT